MPNPLSDQMKEAIERLRHIATQASGEVTVSSADLLLLLTSTSQTENPAPALSCDEAFAQRYKADPGAPGFSEKLEVWRASWTDAGRAFQIESGHQVRILGQALGDCIVDAGIVKPGVGLTGPELLMFSNDLRTHIKQLMQSEDASNTVINFILANPCESPMEFLRCWNEGNFDSLRKEWPEAPDEIYIGPDQFHPKSIGYDTYHDAGSNSLTSVRLLYQCRESLEEGSSETDALIAEVDAYLAGQPFPAGLNDAAGVVQGERGL